MIKAGYPVPPLVLRTTNDYRTDSILHDRLNNLFIAYLAEMRGMPRYYLFYPRTVYHPRQ